MFKPLANNLDDIKKNRDLQGQILCDFPELKDLSFNDAIKDFHLGREDVAELYKMRKDDKLFEKSLKCNK